MEDWRGREQTWLASVSKDDHFMATSFRGTVLPLETLDCEPTLLGNQMRSVEKRRSAVIANKDRLVQCSVFKGLGSEDQALARSTAVNGHNQHSSSSSSSSLKAGTRSVLLSHCACHFRLRAASGVEAGGQRKLAQWSLVPVV